MRADDQGLILGIADAADAHPAFHAAEMFLEFASKLGVLDIVYDARKSLSSENRHSAPARSQMRMIIRAVEKISHAVEFRGHTEHTAHCIALLEDRSVKVFRPYLFIKRNVIKKIIQKKKQFVFFDPASGQHVHNRRKPWAIIPSDSACLIIQKIRFFT